MADFDPVKILQFLREECFRASAVNDGPFLDVRIDTAPILTEAGKLDVYVFELIDHAVKDGREFAAEADWAADPDNPECSHEIFLCRYKGNPGFHEVFDEYAGSIVRCLREIPAVAEEFSLGDQCNERLGAYFEWINILMTLAERNQHPVLTLLKGDLSVGGSREDCQFFYFAGYTIIVDNSEPKQTRLKFARSDDEPVRDPIATAGRFKKLAKARTELRELQCGVLRGSAYAIDWLLQDAGHERNGRIKRPAD